MNMITPRITSPRPPTCIQSWRTIEDETLHERYRATVARDVK